MNVPPTRLLELWTFERKIRYREKRRVFEVIEEGLRSDPGAGRNSFRRNAQASISRPGQDNSTRL
jgi:hypothetical protein